MAFSVVRGREVRQQAGQRLLEIRIEIEIFFSVHFAVSVQDGNGVQNLIILREFF